ncbi:MAG: sigma-70 family RNA polymerase sigma factor [Planctomycetota bacterium]|jgi:RNA polymerase sigma-70 factor (ECF subfamily)
MSVDPDRLQAHAPFLRNFARALLKNEHDAEDLLQDTLGAALDVRARPRGDLRGWLVGVARNLARNRVRRDRRRRRREHVAARAEAVPAVDAVVPRAEMRRILARAVEELPEPDRTILLLRHFEEQSAAEIARRFGVTPKTIRLRLRRSLARLRGDLRRRYGKTRWIASLLVLAARPRPVAALPWVAGALAVALVAVGAALIARETGEPRDKRNVRTVAEVTRPHGGPPPRLPVRPPTRENRTGALDVSPPGAKERRGDPIAEPKTAPAPERRPAVAAIHNAPQKPLPKHGLTPAWGREAIWWSHGGRHYFLAVRRGPHHSDLAFDYELWIRMKDGPAPPATRTARAVRPGDAAFEATKRAWLKAGRMLARGTIHQLPSQVHLLDREPGAVLFERYNHHGHGNTLLYVDRTGHLRWTLRLKDFFSAAERGRFRDVDNSVAWSWRWSGFWVLESRRKVLLLSVDHTLLEVDLDTGVPRRADVGALLAVVREDGPEPARVRALEVVAPLRPQGLDAVLAELAHDGPPALKKRARSLLSRGRIDKLLAALAGPAETLPRVRAELRKWGRDALGPLQELARDTKQPHLLRLRALHLHHAFDPKTPVDAVHDNPAALLADGVLEWRTDGRLARWAEDQVVRFGDAAGAALRKHIRNDGVELQARREATRVLARIRTDAVFDALVALTGHTDNIIVWHAKAGLQSFPAKDLDHRFEALLLKGSPADGAIAEYFQAHPRARVIEALLRAMERRKDDVATRRALGYAVQRCSGRWVAERDDPAAWRHELGR